MAILPPAPPATQGTPIKTRATLRSRLGIWLFSLAAMIVLPLFPLFVEGAKNKWSVKTESYLLTAAVLAAGFGFSTEGNWYRGAYLILFLFAIGYDFHPDTTGASSVASDGFSLPAAGGWILNHPALDAVLLVAGLQVIERFNWHVVVDRLFPDWRKEP